MAKIFNFRAIIEQDEGGTFVAHIPAIPGCHSQGDTYEEVLKNITEATELCLEVSKKDKNYRSKINWGETQDNKNRFLGVVDVPIKAMVS